MPGRCLDNVSLTFLLVVQIVFHVVDPLSGSPLS